jgi:hypothetical protein
MPTTHDLSDSRSNGLPADIPSKRPGLHMFTRKRAGERLKPEHLRKRPKLRSTGDQSSGLLKLPAGQYDPQLPSSY